MNIMLKKKKLKLCKKNNNKKDLKYLFLNPFFRKIFYLTIDSPIYQTSK